MTSNETGPSLHTGCPSGAGKPSVTRLAPQKSLPYAQHHDTCRAWLGIPALSGFLTSPRALQVQTGYRGVRFVYLFTYLLGCFFTETQLCPIFLCFFPKKLLSEFAKEAGRLLWLQEGPKHNLKTKAKTQCGNNIEEHCGKELPVKQLLCWPIPFQGR